MSRFPEISTLFAALTSDLHFHDPTARTEVDASISDLNRSLNLFEFPRVGVLDAALSLMCFTAPQVYDSTADFTLKTIVTVLDSSIECKVSRINKEQILRVGGMISKSDCANVMEACADILKKLAGHKGDLCDSLLYSVIRLAALSPCFRLATPSSSNIAIKFNDSRISIANLLGHLSCEFKSGHGEVPLRVLLWHLDPMILKQDISQILQEIISRPFLSFSMEISNRPKWRSKLICLVLSPLMFIETRALLHDWFLMTGLASVMELQSDLAQQVLDVISRPTWWGLSAEVGLKLPFSQAYFPHEHHILRILSGPIGHEYFQHLLNKTRAPVSHADSHLHTVPKEAAKQLTLVDHKSIWALVTSFPDWFFFATMLLFCNNSLCSGFISSSDNPSYLMNGTEVSCFAAAANFIAWFLNPVVPSNQLVVDYLIKVSELWTLKCSSSKKCEKTKRAHGKEATRLGLYNKNVKGILEDNSGIIWSLINEFTAMHAKIKEFISQQTLLLRRIPFGIMLAHPNLVNEAGCSMILHYAATGSISKPVSGQGQRKVKYNWHGDLELSIGKYTKSEAMAGCRTVFDITDIAESISTCIFDTEENGLDYVDQLKLRTCNYLLACIKRLLQIKQDEDDAQMRRDLLAKVLKWRHQGKDAFLNSVDLDFVCNALIVD